MTLSDLYWFLGGMGAAWLITSIAYVWALSSAAASAGDYDSTRDHDDQPPTP